MGNSVNGTIIYKTKLPIYNVCGVNDKLIHSKRRARYCYVLCPN